MSYKNYMWEFHQICSLRTVGSRDERVRSWGQRSKVNITVIPDMVEKHEVQLETKIKW